MSRSETSPTSIDAIATQLIDEFAREVYPFAAREWSRLDDDPALSTAFHSWVKQELKKLFPSGELPVSDGLKTAAGFFTASRSAFEKTFDGGQPWKAQGNPKRFWETLTRHYPSFASKRAPSANDHATLSHAEAGHALASIPESDPHEIEDESLSRGPGSASATVPAGRPQLIELVGIASTKSDDVATDDERKEMRKQVFGQFTHLQRTRPNTDSELNPKEQAPHPESMVDRSRKSDTWPTQAVSGRIELAGSFMTPNSRVRHDEYISPGGFRQTRMTAPKGGKSWRRQDDVN